MGDGREIRLLFVGASRKALSGLLLLAGVSAGCGWSVKEHLPDEPLGVGVAPAAYRLDVTASSLEYQGDDAPSFTEAWEVRDALGDLLRARAHTVDANGRPAPAARFRAAVNVKRNLWPRTWYVLCIDLQVLGCPTGSSEAALDLQLQVGDRLYVGRGAGSSVGGLYYNRFAGVPSAIAQAMAAAVGSLTYAGRIDLRTGTDRATPAVDFAGPDISSQGGR
jgi:hypothetical protein